MEDFVDDLPLAVDLEQREHVRKADAGPVVELEPNGGDGFDEVDTGDLRLEVCRWPVLVIPVEELLDRASKQIRAVVTEDRRGRRASCRHSCRIWRRRCTAG
jgi:hypothetical protein